jgi:hypothetical protein
MRSPPAMQKQNLIWSQAGPGHKAAMTMPRPTLFLLFQPAGEMKFTTGCCCEKCHLSFCLLFRSGGSTKSVPRSPFYAPSEIACAGTASMEFDVRRRRRADACLPSAWALRVKILARKSQILRACRERMAKYYLYVAGLKV